MQSRPEDFDTAWQNFKDVLIRETGFERLALWFLKPTIPSRSALVLIVAIVSVYLGGSIWMTFATRQI